MDLRSGSEYLNPSVCTIADAEVGGYHSFSSPSDHLHYRLGTVISCHIMIACLLDLFLCFGPYRHLASDLSMPSLLYLLGILSQLPL